MSKTESVVGTDRQAAAEQIAEDFRAVNVALQRVSAPLWLKLGLTMAQLKALFVVHDAGAVCVGDVAAALGIGESAASLLVEQLVRAEYVERRPDPSNRRRVIVTPTQLAKKLIGELRHGRRQVLVEWLASLDDTEIDALLRGLGALAQASSPKPRAQTSTPVSVERGMVSRS